MKIAAFTYGLLLSLIPSVWATLTTTSVIEACSTEFCTTSTASIGSKTTTYTLSQVATVTSVPHTTITPKASTATVKSTTIVTSTKTLGTVATLTSTSTVITSTSVTVTAVVTVSTVATVTVTVTPTYTVPTSAGQIFESAVDPELKRRDLRAHPHEKRVASTTASISSTKTHYPIAVTCGVLVDVYGTTTKTASSTATVTIPASTVKVTSTITGTVTSTSCHASVTSTSTTTLAVTVSVTTTITTTIDTGPATTVTATAATTSVYAACATDNLLTSDVGYAPNGYYPNDNYVTLTTDSAYDCCVACQTNGDCAGAVFDTTAGNLCTIDTPLTSTCDPGYIGLYYGTDTVYDGAFEGQTVIAGPCGIAAGT